MNLSILQKIDNNTFIKGVRLYTMTKANNYTSARDNSANNRKWGSRVSSDVNDDDDDDDDNDNRSINLLESSDSDDDNDDDDHSMNLLETDNDDDDDNIVIAATAATTTDDDDDDDKTVIPENMMCSKGNKQQEQDPAQHPRYRLQVATDNHSRSPVRLVSTGRNRSMTTVTNNDMKNSRRSGSSNSNRTTTVAPARILPEESPTTKTLNSLSQNMDDLQYDYHSSIRSSDDDDSSYSRNGNIKNSNNKYDRDEDERLLDYRQSSSKKSTVSIAADVAAATFYLPAGFEKEWEIISIRDTSSSSSDTKNRTTTTTTTTPILGLKIVRDNFPHSNENGISKLKKLHCIVTKVEKNGWGYENGLQENDWFLQPMDVSTTSIFDDGYDSLMMNDESQKSCHPYYDKIAIEQYEKSGPLRLATFAEIQKWIRTESTNYRPIRILRRRHNIRRRTTKARTTTTLTQTAGKKRTTKDTTKNISSNVPPKAMKSCMHCGKSFVPRGIASHLRSCKRNPGNNTTAAVTTRNTRSNNSTTVVAISRSTRDKNRSSMASEAAAAEQYLSTSNTRKRSSNTITSSRSNNRNESDNASDTDSNSDKVSRHKRKNPRRQAAAAVSKRSTSKMFSTTTTISKSKKKSNILNNNNFGTEDRATSEGGEKQEETTTATARSNKVDDSTEAGHIVNNNYRMVKPKWIPLYDNPWGEEGFQAGDVLLFGPQRGIGHHEIHMPSLRYKTNPFWKDSIYNNTHCTPQEGLDIICLNRDTLGNTQWGFSVTRHEFGHACLVETVDRSSPASAATFTGLQSNDQQSLPSSSPTTGSDLNVNDMIIMINEKQVGGMTEVGFELELELSTSSLFLVVSRYKHTEDAVQKFALMEQQMFENIDNAARDNRLHGWQEIGNGTDPSDPPLTVEGTTNNSQFKRNRSKHIKTKSTEKSTTKNQAYSSSNNIHMVQKEKKDLKKQKQQGTGSKEQRQQSSHENKNALIPKGLRSHCNESKYWSLDIDSSTTTTDVETNNENGNGRVTRNRKGDGGDKMVENVITVNSETKGVTCKRQRVNLKYSIESDDECDEARHQSLKINDKNDDDSNDDSSESDNSMYGDRNPQMGCICGVSHNERYTKFWLQCESCRSWYEVAQKCIGFDIDKAANIVWHCEVCVPATEE